MWAHVSCPTPRESCHGSTIPAALSTGASTPSINAPSSLELRLNLDFIHSSYGIRLRGELNPDFWCTASVTAIADAVVGERSVNLGWWSFLHAVHLKVTSSSPFTAKPPVPRWDTCRSTTQSVLSSGTYRFHGRTGEPRAELHNRYSYPHRMDSETRTSHAQHD